MPGHRSLLHISILRYTNLLPILPQWWVYRYHMSKAIPIYVRWRGQGCIDAIRCVRRYLSKVWITFENDFADTSAEVEKCLVDGCLL